MAAALRSFALAMAFSMNLCDRSGFNSADTELVAPALPQVQDVLLRRERPQLLFLAAVCASWTLADVAGPANFKGGHHTEFTNVFVMNTHLCFAATLQ